MRIIRVISVCISFCRWKPVKLAGASLFRISAARRHYLAFACICCDSVDEWPVYFRSRRSRSTTDQVAGRRAAARSRTGVDAESWNGVVCGSKVKRGAVCCRRQTDCCDKTIDSRDGALSLRRRRANANGRNRVATAAR